MDENELTEVMRLHRLYRIMPAGLPAYFAFTPDGVGVIYYDTMEEAHDDGFDNFVGTIHTI